MGGLFGVVLVLHVLIAIAMIGLILLQRSEGGALGIGGGSGSFLSARSAGNVLTRATVILVILFFLTSMGLTVLGRQSAPKTLDLGTSEPAGTSAPQPVAPVPASQPAEMPATQGDEPGDLPALPGFPGSAPAGETPASAAPATPGAPGAAPSAPAPAIPAPTATAPTP